jgi:hypothetical protein
MALRNFRSWTMLALAPIRDVGANSRLASFKNLPSGAREVYNKLCMLCMYVMYVGMSKETHL